MADNPFDSVAPTPVPAAAPPRPAAPASRNPFDDISSPAPAAVPTYEGVPIKLAQQDPVQKAGGTALRRLGDVMESFTFAPLLGIGDTHPGRPSYGQMMGSAFSRLGHGGDFSGFSDVASEYGFGTPAENEYLAKHGRSSIDRSVGQFMQAHPFINAATTFGVEWENPANRLFGPAARLGGRAVVGTAKLAAKTPVVGPAAAKSFGQLATATSQFFNRWHDLEQAGGPDAVQAGMQIVSEKNAVPANARPLIAQIFGYTGARGVVGGLTKAQHYEIGRLSQRLPRDTSVPEAAHGPTLSDRAVMLRKLLKDVDDEQRSVGLLVKGRTFNPETYIPMQPEITYAEHEPREPNESGRPTGATFSGRVRKGTSAPGKSKTYLDLDQVRAGEDPAQFAEHFDLAENIRQHYVQRMQNVVIERGIRRFAKVLNPQAGSMLRPLLYRLNRGGAMMMFGEGEKGAKTARLWAAAEAHRIAKLKAAEEAGLVTAPREQNTGQLIGQRTATSRFHWKLSNLAQAGLRAAAKTAREAEKAVPPLGKDVGFGKPIDAKKVAAVDPDLSADELTARADLQDLIGQHTTTVPGIWRTMFRQSDEAEHLIPERYQEPAYHQPFGVYKQGGRYVFRVNDVDTIDPQLVEQARELFKKAGYDRARYGFISGAAAEQRAGKFVAWLAKSYKMLPKELTPETASKAYDYARNMRQGIEGLPRRQRYSRVNEAKTQRIDSGIAALQRYLEHRGVGTAADITGKVRAEKATRGAMGATPTETAASVLSRMSKKERARYENQREATLRAMRRPVVGLSSKVGQAASDQVDKLGKIDDAISQRQLNNDQARLVKMIARGFEKDIRRRLWQDVVEESAPVKGHKLAIDQRGAPLLDSPSLRKMTVDAALFKFLRDDLGAPAESASVLSRYWTTLNSLARVGIVSNPIIHPTWNLGFMFLAGGGDLSFLNPLSRRSLFHDPDVAWSKRATTAGADFKFSQGIFGLSDQHEATILTGAMRELGMTGKIDKVASAVWRANQHVVFDIFEHRYSVELFRKLVEDFGKSDAEAAIMVRKALGDYTNLTRQERVLHNLFFFYPWMKTVVPFWTKKGLEAPQWWNAPSRAIANWNASHGDQGTSNPFSIALGQGRYYTPLMPQRVLNPIAQAASPPQPGEDWLSAHAQPAANYLVGHTNPFISTMVDLFATMQEPAQKPGFYVILDKDAPASTQAKQLAQGVLGQFAYPFREGRGIFQGVDKADYAPLLGVVPGGFVTVEDPDALRKAEYGIRHKYEGAIRGASDPIIKAALKQKLQDDLAKLEAKYGGSP